MNQKLRHRLNQILPKITSDDFLLGRGIGNEIAFHIFDYLPQRELFLRQHRDFLLFHFPQQGHGPKLAHPKVIEVVLD